MRRVVQPSAALLTLSFTFAAWQIGIGEPLPAARADDPQTDAAKQEARERKERYSKWMREYAEATSIRVRAPGDDRDEAESEAAEFVAQPVFRYSSEVYADDATLWIWTRNACPVALQKIEVNNVGGGQNWTICFASVSEGLVTAHWPQGRPFTAIQPGVKFRPIPDADAPAESPKKRLAQVKVLKERFSGVVSFSDPNLKPNELNPITAPLFEYNDPGSNLPRGAIFSMVGPRTDRNPGFLLFLEARTDGEEKSRWEYAGARLGTAGVMLRLDNIEVWSLPIVRENKRIFDNWTYFFLPRDFK